MIAIENVYVWDNTSVVVDEVLAHRIGLVPLNVNPAFMLSKSGPEDPPTDRNTLVFRIDITCQRNPNAPKGSTNPDELYIDHELLSKHLTWVPAGEQETIFAGSPPAPTNPDIVLTKLRPGQGVNMELHAVKGVGKDHAKFSPVGECFRLLNL
jgi:DNA-directed RNA polymerases I and III subunit RPAC1